MSTNVLFLCPHGAAKSVFARFYFKKLAAEAGLDVEAENAGTDPDPFVNLKVARYLANEGIDVSELSPTLLTSDHLTRSDWIISMGCIESDQAPEGKNYRDWSDVPMLSDGFQHSRDFIYQKVVDLVKELKAAEEAS